MYISKQEKNSYLNTIIPYDFSVLSYRFLVIIAKNAVWKCTRLKSDRNINNKAGMNYDARLSKNRRNQ